MKKIKQLLNCQVCKTNDSVKYTLKCKDNCVEINIYKCTNCKHQHVISDFFKK